MSDYRLLHGDCLDLMKAMDAESVDSIVTDPPYGLSFMGKRWDYDVPSVEIWAECLRVLKPGGHLLAFAGTRTQHRMAVRIENAGFEIRDLIAWVYGSGFPKSLDVSKAIDKVRDWSKVERLNAEIRRARESGGMSLKQIGEAMQEATAGQYGAWYHRGGHMFFETGRSLPSRPEWDHLRRVLPIAPEFQDAYDKAEREVIGHHRASAPGQNMRAGIGGDGDVLPPSEITAPATDAARQWQGWGTALKPAMEPITVARKPLCGTVAENVLAHGTGAINVDGCRVGTESTKRVKEGGSNQFPHEDDTWIPKTVQVGSDAGRWPANLIHDGSDEVNKLFPQTGISLGGKAGNDKAYCGGFRQEYYGNTKPGFGDSGSAARFFYCAKASKSDRGDDNDHPTVKPTNLMQYLCRLVTPPGGTVLDPFMGSGSTGKGAVLEGFKFVGCEKESQYVEIARKRIESVSGLFAKEQ